MTDHVLQLYPLPSDSVPVSARPLRGLYLAHQLQTIGTPQQPYVYGNFVASLDGRIAIGNEAGDQSEIPETLNTSSDWLLFQELQAQADCFVTHGAYLRALALGRLDDILQVGTKPESAYLLDWRRQNALPDQPGIIVVSNSLSFPIPPSVREHKQPFHIVTTAAADRTKVKIWRDKGFEIIFAGTGDCVQGEPLVAVLSELGFRSAYLQAGPLLLGAMLRDRLLGRLYLTQSHQVIGGETFHTIMTGATLEAGAKLQLASLYFDPESERQTGQFFACFEPQSV